MSVSQNNCKNVMEIYLCKNSVLLSIQGDLIIAAPQGGFIAQYILEIVGRKNLTIFKGCYYSWFYMMISLSFRKIETHNSRTLFASNVSEWNRLDLRIRNYESLPIFRKKYSSFQKTSSQFYLNYHNPKGVKLITRLRLGMSHLREHKFKHNFQDSINPLCNCGHDIESTTHFVLHPPLFVSSTL